MKDRKCVKCCTVSGISAQGVDESHLGKTGCAEVVGEMDQQKAHLAVGKRSFGSQNVGKIAFFSWQGQHVAALTRSRLEVSALFS